MRRRRRHLASPDEVRISREGDDAIIEYADHRVSTTHIKIGPQLKHMSDGEVLDLFNTHLQRIEEIRLGTDDTVVEIPPGKPQIEFHEDSGQWTPRGDVLRCVIEDGGPGGEAVICIDDHELSLQDFGRLLVTYAGWGMRILFVDEYETHLQPPIEVREPEEKT